jgi:hypothetical protein
MKSIIIIFLLTTFTAIQVNAQSDTLIITLKNNQVEKIPLSQVQKIEFENITGVNEPQPISTLLQVNQNYPNPFSENTSLEFEIASPGTVDIIIYDNSGNKIQTLKCENCQPGKNTISWNSLDMNKKLVQSGLYFYEVRFGNEKQSRKMIVVR